MNYIPPPAPPLFIFEIANNHQGSVDHGLAIVRDMAMIARRHGIDAAVKLQYRELDSFIHPDFAKRIDVPHVPRFIETRLSWPEFQLLVQAIRDSGMLSIVTPFDEASVEHCLNHGVDVLKVASSSANDWPLLEVVAAAQKPVICSTGGCSLSEIDRLVSFFEHRKVSDLALLHCISLYPTNDENQQLSFMQRMIRRYPTCRIGFSGHEAPDNHAPGVIAAAMGAKILERHVGLPTEAIRLNAYSMNPQQVDAWIHAVLAALRLCGTGSGEKFVTETELSSLRSLKRGVFAKRSVAKGERLNRDLVFFAMPCGADQMPASEWKEGVVATKDYEAGSPIVDRRPVDAIQIVRAVVHEAKGFLREAGIALGCGYQIELSHHFGMEKFRRFGAILVEFFNREYCKKLIILLPGQHHPMHSHIKKEETFQVLYGEMELTLNSMTETLRAGDCRLIQRGDWHSFTTEKGVIFEEISTTHVQGDSLYEDPVIRSLDPIQRKTVIADW